jgi:hypothetical protein
MYDNEPTMMGPGRPVATLVVRQGAQAGMSFPLAGNQIVIGREEGVDVILQDAESSRRHSRITWQGSQFIIEDMGSTNGTFVNGVQITSPQLLNSGDSIGIGQTALVFQVTGGAQRGYAPQVAPTYRMPDYAPAAPVAAKPAQENKTTQYLLYGCGCLLLLGICLLLATAAVVLLAPNVVENLTGLKLSFNFIPLLVNWA